jgi:ribosomal protein S21
MISANKRDGESSNALIFRFTKKVRRSGLMQEVRKRRFSDRGTTRRKRRLSAIFKSAKKEEMAKQKKLGLI